jgi:deazaflavin-dependent oxidoreductase (nitroreductase family)
MAGPTILVLAVLSLALSAIGIVYVIGIRTKSSTVRDAARHFHHRLGNPLQMRSAGTSGTYASVIRHRGRATGRVYETPVWAAPTEDGFVIAIVYGPRTDWLKNVLASGSAAIVRDGGTHPVHQPEVVSMESARAYFPAMIRTIHRRIQVDRYLRVRLLKAATASATRSSWYPGKRDEPDRRRLTIGERGGER